MTPSANTPQVAMYPVGTVNTLVTVPMSDTEIAECRSGHAKFMRDCKTHGVVPVLHTIPPVAPASRNWDASDAKRVALNTNALAYPELNTIDFAAVWSGSTDVDGQVLWGTGMNVDGFHPSDLGNTTAAPVIANFLSKVG